METRLTTGDSAAGKLAGIGIAVILLTVTAQVFFSLYRALSATFAPVAGPAGPAIPTIIGVIVGAGTLALAGIIHLRADRRARSDTDAVPVTRFERHKAA